MTQRSVAAPSADEIRAVVQRIVDGLLLPDSEELEETAPVEPATADGAATSATITIALGSDHGGYALKERIGYRLRESGLGISDVGTHSQEPVDYPDFAHEVAAQVAAGEADWGIIIDGAGIGSAIVANKVPGVRAANCWDISSARNSREHNHANVLCLGAGLMGPALALQIVEEWLAVEWAAGRHARRVEKITDIERRYSRGS